MIVRCLRSTYVTDDPECPVGYLDVTVGRLYRVLAIEYEDYRLVGDEGEPNLYPADPFEIVDSTYDPDWVEEVDADGDMCIGPSDLLQVGLFEDYFDGVESAQVILRKYLERAADIRGTTGN